MSVLDLARVEATQPRDYGRIGASLFLESSKVNAAWNKKDDISESWCWFPVYTAVDWLVSMVARAARFRQFDRGIVELPVTLLLLVPLDAIIITVFHPRGPRKRGKENDKAGLDVPRQTT